MRKIAGINWSIQSRTGKICVLICFSFLCCGCAALTNPVADGIPVSELPTELLACSREGEETVPLSFLQQPVPDTYRVGPDDVLGIYVEGVLDADSKLPEIRVPEKGRLTPERAGLPSAIGYPVRVRSDGAISLPQSKPIAVNGLSLEEVEQAIRKAYTIDAKILKPGRDRIVVTLLHRRVHRVLVFRRDLEQGLDRNLSVTRVGLFGAGAELVGTGITGRGMEIDLPAYNNDLLHALAATGGFPGTNAFREVIIYRSLKNNAPKTVVRGQDVVILPPIPSGPITLGSPRPIENKTNLGPPREITQPAHPQNADMVPIVPEILEQKLITRIPIRLLPGRAIPFQLNDIILNDGDIVLVKAAPVETFYSGGLLPSAEHILPRDYDLDVVEAVSRVRGPMINGAFGGSNLSGALIVPGIGNPSPRLLTVVRRLPGGGQVPIKVDLFKALVDPRERIFVKDSDVLILQETRKQAIARYFTQVFNIGGILKMVNRKDATVFAEFFVP